MHKTDSDACTKKTYIIQIQKRPKFIHKRDICIENRDLYTQKRPLFTK